MKTRGVSTAEPVGLSVSIVVFRPEPAQLAQTLESLAVACEVLQASGTLSRLYLIDNGGLPVDATAKCGVPCTVIAGQGNIGYGRGHNLAIEQAESRYHLVLNPDVDLERTALMDALHFLDEHQEVGLLAPCIVNAGGAMQYLCRRYPTLLDLFVRGFLPAGARTLFARRLANYEMRDVINERDIVWDPPIISGCFMLFRTNVLKTLAGFDPRYFLYFEDYDLSLRTHKVARVSYVPKVRIIHYGGDAARKGHTHIKMFLASAFKFYNRFGWKWFGRSSS